MSTDDQKYKLSDEILDRSIGDDLLVHRSDNDDVYVLNTHARLVFDALKAGGTRTDVRRYVAEKGFDDEAAIAAVDRALQEMLDQGLALVDEP